MKKKYYWILVIYFFTLTTSCKKALKDVNDYFPKLKTVSATIQTDGTVLIEGEVISEGAATIEYIGFCYSTSIRPNMVSNQIWATTNGTKFSAIYPGSGFDVDSVYYFRTWATNYYGYVYGNDISLDSIIAMNVTPPCTNAMNTVNEGGGQATSSYINISTPVNYMNEWEFTAQTGSGPTVNFTFGSILTTGIYTTTTNTSPGYREVNISFYGGFISGTLSDGSSVYMNTIGSDVYDISICSAPWQYNSSIFYFNTRLTVD